MYSCNTIQTKDYLKKVILFFMQKPFIQKLNAYYDKAKKLYPPKAKKPN